MNSNLVVTLEYKKPSLLLKIILWTLGLIFLAIVSALIYLNVITNRFATEFSKAAGINKEELYATGTSLLNQFQADYEKVAELPKKHNFLILGTDKLSGRDGDPELTDTILLLQTNFETGKIKTLSFPRDLYLEDLQTRINALYFYGQEKYPEEPQKFTEETIEKLTGLNIDNTVVISIEDLQELIKIVGDIEIDVPTAFTDPLFPVPGVDVSSVSDPKILYEKISFTAGPQTMDSATALKYMRSRHSEGDQGTDQARSARQQLVLQALLNKMTKIKSPQTLGLLYRFYLDRFAKYISLQELSKIVTVGIDYLSKNEAAKIEFEKHQLSVYPEDPNGIIYNPPLWQTNQQWVYEIKDQNKFTGTINAIFN
jgi:LCP family protein required for cell wall assembly